jgi:hypothetical protein
MVETITFNTAESKLVVTLEDGTSKEYTDAESYIADFPERVADAVAMGWEVTVVEAPVEEVTVETPIEE